MLATQAAPIDPFSGILRILLFASWAFQRKTNNMKAFREPRNWDLSSQFNSFNWTEDNIELGQQVKNNNGDLDLQTLN